MGCSPRSGIERNSAVFAGADVLEDEPVPLFDTRFGSPSRGQLERGDRPSRRGDAPGREAVPDADDRAVARQEDDVDREAHEEHVHRAGPVDQHPAIGLEAAPAKNVRPRAKKLSATSQRSQTTLPVAVTT